MIRNIKPEELYQLLQSIPDLLLIDVRESQELVEVRTEYAQHIPLREVNANTLVIYAKDKEQPIYFMCRSGGRSLMAAQASIDAGYKNVFNVSGGITEWEERGLPTLHQVG